MSNTSKRKVQHDSDIQLNWTFNDEMNSCPDCNAVGRRDEEIINVLQQARYILASRDLIEDPGERIARAKSALDEALRLMNPLRS